MVFYSRESQFGRTISLNVAIKLMNDKKQEDFKDRLMFQNPDRWSWYYIGFGQMISNLG
jgi:hypothetical protein